MRAAPGYPGLERIEARFVGNAYARHRHDTYALGVTLRGVQSFWYRGEVRASLPGQVIILHPDEIHDGGAGTEQGLTYRMLYLDPALVQAGLQNAGLPFVAEPVVDDVALRSALLEAFGDMDEMLEPLVADQVVTELTEGLSRRADAPPKRASLLDLVALARVAELLNHAGLQPIRSDELEAVSGLDRFTLARQFRARFGTSPHRYLTMRRVTQGRRLLAAGQSIANVAAETGFADQSHFHRHFLKAFGMTPGRWQRLVASR
ncbi:AraC family transcriptional regulator [Devosia insulae]|uniref:AraC family transcriptional regulator n=1 Tax=Devosia insulae TaxID=408174 RepID=UPI001FCD673E|nr:AraC family transcriptional regulator [Devosia insulae]